MNRIYPIRLSAYHALFKLTWQRNLEERANVFLERIRNVALFFSLYFMWSAVLGNRGSILGYEKAQLLTYVIGMSLLRALVLSAQSDQVAQEIASGRVAAILLRPIHHLLYWLTRDLAEKALHGSAVIVELAVFILLLRPSLFFPHQWSSLLFSISGILLAGFLYFLMTYLVGLAGFWTSESGGPRFCFALLLEFCAGAFFPLDVLPAFLRGFLLWTPFPYMVFFPLNIYLGRLDSAQILQGMCIGWAWVAVIGMTVHYVWQAGLRSYAAEGG